jgi:hypothetical protein
MHNASAKSALMIRERGSRPCAFLSSEMPSLFAPHHDQMPCIPVTSRRIAGIEVDGPLVFRLGGPPVPAIQVQGESQRGVGFSEALVPTRSASMRRTRSCNARTRSTLLRPFGEPSDRQSRDRAAAGTTETVSTRAAHSIPAILR